MPTLLIDNSMIPIKGMKTGLQWTDKIWLCNFFGDYKMVKYLQLRVLGHTNLFLPIYIMLQRFNILKTWGKLFLLRNSFDFSTGIGSYFRFHFKSDQVVIKVRDQLESHITSLPCCKPRVNSQNFKLFYTPLSR